MYNLLCLVYRFFPPIFLHPLILPTNINPKVMKYEILAAGLKCVAE